MICPECKNEIADGARFCANCGCEINAICGDGFAIEPVNDKSFAFGFSAVEGTLLYDAGMRKIAMVFTNMNIEFRDVSIFGKAEPVYLSYSQVRDFRFVKQRLDVQKSKSVVGRAVVGGLLFGSVGAVVGGISGTGKKASKKIKNFLVIDYISQNGEKRSLSLNCCGLRARNKEKLSTLLKERCPNILPANHL